MLCIRQQSEASSVECKLMSSNAKEKRDEDISPAPSTEACLNVGGCADVAEADFLLPVWVLQAHGGPGATFVVLAFEHSIDLAASHSGLLPQSSGGRLLGHEVLLVEEVLDVMVSPSPGIRQSLESIWLAFSSFCMQDMPEGTSDCASDFPCIEQLI